MGFNYIFFLRVCLGGKSADCNEVSYEMAVALLMQCTSKSRNHF
jgi:hypothetical protein